DVVLLGEPETAERVEACVRRLPGRLGGEELRQVRLGAAWLLLVEEPCSLVPDEIGGLKGSVRTRNGKLNALIRTDRATEDLRIDRGRSCEKEHDAGVQRSRRPDLLASNDVATVGPLGGREDLRRVGADGGLGDAECLQSKLSRGDSRQQRLLLLVASVPENG